MVQVLKGSVQVQSWSKLRTELLFERMNYKYIYYKVAMVVDEYLRLKQNFLELVQSPTHHMTLLTNLRTRTTIPQGQQPSPPGTLGFWHGHGMC